MRNKKGFTLVELLAVVVILGIIMVIAIPAVSRWINSGKNASKESQKKALLMAAQSYAQNNSSVLPKAIGDTSIINVQDLKNSKYLKEDIKDADKKSCMKDSFVRIYKYDRKGYTYTAYIYCEGDLVPDEIVGIKPNIDISFTGIPQEGKVQSVLVSKVIIEMDGNVDSEGNSLGLDGYSYSISVQYNNTGELVEIFHSGSLNAGGRSNLKIEKDLSEYVDIRKANYFVVTVEAYNRDGGYEKKTGNSLYDDDTPPSCGAITGEAGDDEWYTTNRPRTITVACIDNENGSGCVKDSYTKTFDRQMKNGVITIQDNAGNTKDCTVKVHIDWTKPSFTFVSYTRTATAGKGTEVGRITVNNSNDNAVFNTYTGNVNGWLNNEKFPHGIYYEITADDNVSLSQGIWSYNVPGIYDLSAENLYNLNSVRYDDFSSTKTANRYLSVQGIRRAKYVLEDEAGNAATLNLEVNMDRTDPTCETKKTATASATGVTSTIDCTDNESGCSTTNTLSYTNQTISTSYTIYDVAGNSGTCSITIKPQLQTRTATWNSCLSTSNTCRYGCAEDGYFKEPCPEGFRHDTPCTSDDQEVDCYKHVNTGYAHFQGFCVYVPATGCSNCYYGNANECVGGWNNWSDWSNATSCTPTASQPTQRECRTIYN